MQKAGDRADPKAGFSEQPVQRQSFGISEQVNGRCISSLTQTPKCNRCARPVCLAVRATHLCCGGVVVLGQQRAEVSWVPYTPQLPRESPTTSPVSTEGLRQDWILLSASPLSPKALRRGPRAAGSGVRAVPDALAGI